VTESVGADKTAVADAAIHPLLAQRWSPRGFDTRRDVSSEDLASLLEAARWGASGGNTQPWRVLVARRGRPDHGRVFETLARGNQIWAGAAPLLIVMLAKTAFPDGKPHPSAEYDAGQAAALLSIQAEALGLSVHQMGGFDKARLTEEFGLAPDLLPKTVIAVGYLDPDADLPEQLAARERAPRRRMAISEFVLNPES
jgi:nitroreductase